MISGLDFGKLLELKRAGLFTDITLVAPSANNAEFRLHKLVLAASSSYFDGVLKANPAIDRIVLPNPALPESNKNANQSTIYNVIFDGLYSQKQIKDFINEGMSVDNSFTYYSVADSLKFDPIKRMISQYIESSVVNPSNCSQVMVDATKLGVLEVANKCADLMMQDFGRTINSRDQMDRLLRLPYNSFLTLVKNDNMVVDSEDSVFDLIIKYIQFREKPDGNTANPSVPFINKDPTGSTPIANTPGDAGAPQPTTIPPPSAEVPKPAEVPNPNITPAQTPPVDPANPIPASAPPSETVSPSIPNEFQIPDFAILADSMMAILPLNDDQKKQLLLALRYKYISHEKLMKEAKNPLLDKFRDVLMEGLSAKLRNFEPNSQMYIINNNPRAHYTNPVLSNAANSTQAFQVTNEGRRGGGGTTERIVGSGAGPGRGNQQIVNQQNIKNGGRPMGATVSTMGGSGTQGMMRSDYDRYSGAPKTSQIPIPLGFSNYDGYPNTQNAEGYNVFSEMDKKYQQGKADETVKQGLRSALAQSSIGGGRGGSGQIDQHYGIGQGTANYSMGAGDYGSGQDNLFDSVQANQQEAEMIFTYRYDFDENGALYYLGTKGNTANYTNPYSLSLVKVFFSSMGKGSYEDLVGRSVVNCRTLNEPNAFMGIDLGLERYIVPSCYTLRNRDSSRHIMLNWLFEGSVDFKTWFILDKRIHKTDDPAYNKLMEKERQMIERRAATSTWSIDQNYLKAASRSVVMQSKAFSGFRYFRVKQISKNSSAADNLALSGFELYGIAKGANWRIF